jgi:hypothetical protein
MLIMKRILLLLLFVSYCICANAQVSSLSQNFDGVCTSDGIVPGSWYVYNSVAGTATQGAWGCDLTHGRKNAAGTPTPGMSCTGVWSSSYHLDTSYLVTPLLSFPGHSHAYLYFDSKADSILLGGKLRVLVYPVDTPVFRDTGVHVDATASLTPVISVNDSTDWVTHMVDLTSFLSGNFYVAFMYTSNTTSGSVWHIDNINTTFYRLETPSIEKGILPLRVLGNATSSHILLSFGNAQTGAYQLAVYDMMGRQVHTEMVSLQGANESYQIKDINLLPGMYIIKMMGENAYGMTKAIVE